MKIIFLDSIHFFFLISISQKSGMRYIFFFFIFFIFVVSFFSLVFAPFVIYIFFYRKLKTFFYFILFHSIYIFTHPLIKYRWFHIFCIYIHGGGIPTISMYNIIPPQPSMNITLHPTPEYINLDIGFDNLENKKRTAIGNENW